MGTFFGRPYWRTVIRCAALVAVMVVAAGCTGQYEARSMASSEGRPAAASVVVGPGHSAYLRLADGLEVYVPAHAVTGVGTLSAAVTTAPAPAPSLLTFWGHVYALHLTGTTLRGRVRLTVPVRLPGGQGLPAGSSTALLAYYDSQAGQWRPVNASYNSGTHVLVATTGHLSDYAAQGPDTQQLLSPSPRPRHRGRGALWNLLARWVIGVPNTAQPSCPNTKTLTAQGFTWGSTSGDEVKWCAGFSGGHAVIQVASNRDYMMKVGYPPDWSMNNPSSLDPIMKAILGATPMVTEPGKWLTLIPGAGHVEFTLPAGSSGDVLIQPAAEAFADDVLLFGVNTYVLMAGSMAEAAITEADKAKVILHMYDDTNFWADLMAVIKNPDVSTPQAAWSVFQRATDVVVYYANKYRPDIYNKYGIDRSAVENAQWLISAMEAVNKAPGYAHAIWDLLTEIQHGGGYRIWIKPLPLPVAYEPGYSHGNRVYSPEIRPREFQIWLSPAGGSGTLMTSLTWSRWDRNEAVGSGHFQYGSRTGTIVLSRPVRAADGTLYYSKLTISDGQSTQYKWSWSAKEWIKNTPTSSQSLPDFYFYNLSPPEKLYVNPAYPNRMIFDNHDWIKIQRLDAWGAGSMRMTGIYYGDLCQPNCLSGPFVKIPVQVVASAPQTCTVRISSGSSETPEQAYIFSRIAVRALSGATPSYVIGASPLSVCNAPPSQPQPTPSSGTAGTTRHAPCTSAALTSALSAANAQNLPQNWIIKNYACQSGYAFAGIYGTGLPVVALFKQQGASWQLIYGPAEDTCCSPT